MEKCLKICVFLLIGLIFITGCPKRDSELFEKKEVLALDIEPSATELPKNEPAAEIQTQQTKPEEAPEEKPTEEKSQQIKAVAEKPQKKVAVEPKRSGANLFHDKCAVILNNFVDDTGMVNYAKLRRQRLKLGDVLKEFEELDLKEYGSWAKEDKIAFWMNAYNLELLNIIVKNYPIKGSKVLNIFFGPNSIRHIKGIWSSYKFIVMDEEFTLGEIEKRFFREEFGEPRVFCALSRASLSGPPLRNKPYYGDQLDKQLDKQVKKFLSNPLAFEIDIKKKTVRLSVLFEPKPAWYANEFVLKYRTDKKFKNQPEVTRAVLNFITNYIPSQDVSFLEVENYTIEYMRYNWTLNE